MIPRPVAVECFRECANTFYTDNFSPKALVSHNSAFSDEELRKVDLLPKLKNKFFLTPELASIFSLRDDELLQVLGILIRVLDGHGYESDTGAHGHRGYNEEIMFTWVRAVVDISWKVHKMLGNLGSKLYFFRLPRNPLTVHTYHDLRNGDFAKKISVVRRALSEYREYYELNPDIVKEEGNPLSKIQMDIDKDEELADYIIIRLAMLLAHLRAVVPTWDTSGTQGSEYGYTFANIEDPSRAIQQLRNLAWGHAISMGRDHFTMEDVPLVIHTALSTASMSRVRIFEFLIANRGTVTTDQIVDFLNISRPTALRTMTELKATELVDMIDQEPGVYNSVKEIRLREQFDWFLSDEFKELKERVLNLVNIRCKEKLTPPAQTHIDDNIDSDSDSDDHNDTDTHARGGGFSLHPPKPLIEWTASDFRSNGCIYCINNGGYHGPLPLTTYEYETHIVMKHKDRPAYPGPADIQKYGLKLNGDAKEKNNKLAEMAEANESGNGVMFGNGEEPKK